jgi:peptidyl-prolyl cis-trans isomerase SurA
MPIKRTLVVLSLAAAVLLTGCSSDGDATGSGGETAATGQPTSAPGEAGGVPEADVDDVPEVVAEVNGDDITRDEFLENYEGMLQQAAMQQQSAGGGEVDQDALKTQVAEMLVDNRLLTQAATEAGIEASAEDTDAMLEEIAAQSGLGSADEVIAALGEQGFSEEDVRRDAAIQFQLNTFIEQETDVQEPSDEELKAQYDSLVEQMGGAEAAPEGQEIPPFEEVRDQLAQQSVSEQQNAAAQEIVTKLREGADITVHL